jgi:hypothetical protein
VAAFLFTFLMVWVSPLTFGFIHLLALAGLGCLAAADAGPAARRIQRPPAGHGPFQQGQSFSAQCVWGRSFPFSAYRWHFLIYGWFTILNPISLTALGLKQLSG